MADTVIVTGDEGEAAASPSIETEAVVAAADASVEIAQIDADRAVAVEEIAAETARVGIEADKERNTQIQVELEQCQQNIATMQASLSTVQEELKLILSRLTPLELLLPQTPAVDESVESAVMPGNQEVPAQAQPKRKALRLI